MHYQHEFSSWPSRFGPNIREIIRTIPASRLNKMWRLPFSTRKNNLQNKNWAWMRRQPQAHCCRGLNNRFHDLKKRSFRWCCWKQTWPWTLNQSDWEKVIEFQDVSFAYENKPILQGFNLLVQAKDRIGIVGDNGVGKSTRLISSQWVLND